MNQWEDLKKLFITAFFSSLVESDKVIFCFPLIRASEDGQQKTSIMQIYLHGIFFSS